MRTTHPDTTYKEAAYIGCGCAGGEVVTLTDEGTLDAGIAKRRQQKIHSDVLGRTVKTEILNWQNGSPYSTTVNTYNARDQLTQVRQYAGTEGSGTYQDTTMTYDGYGRLKTKHVPEQTAGMVTTYDYFADDNIQKVTDARGAAATYVYNDRHLVTEIIYSAPEGSQIPEPATNNYSYDAASNRTAMTDGLGTVSYEYDELSRLVSETRGFMGVGNYEISYQYNLANQLSTITNPFDDAINYTRDTAGRLTAVTGTTFGSFVPVSTYASNIQYRAWGAMKQLTSGDSKTVNATYNSRMQTATFSVTGLISKTYDYFADGRLRFSSDLLDHRFDRSYAFDHVARLKNAFSGAEARGELATTNRPYYQTNVYDSFNHLTQRTVKIWSTSDNTVSDSYTNNRHAPQGSSWQYDADGRLLSSATDFYTYDAAGLTTNIEVPTTNSIHTSVGYDGDGRQVRTDETTWDPEMETEVTDTKFFVRSSVLGGQVLTELLPGIGGRTFVYANQAIIAWQWLSYGWEVVDFEHKDPSGASVRRGATSQELDPLGGDAGISAQTQIPDEGAFTPYGNSYNAADPSITYTVDGMRVPVSDFMAFAGIALDEPFLFLEEFVRRTRKDIAMKWYRGIPDLTELPKDWKHFRLPNPQDPTSKPLDPSQMQRLLTGDCVHFLNSILAELGEEHRPYSNNFPSILRKAGDRLFTRRMTDEEKKEGWGGTNSVVDDPAFYIYLDEGQYNWGDYHGGYLLIHELFHAAGSSEQYNHTQMANAAYNAAKANPALWKELVRHGVKEPRAVDYSSGEKYIKDDDWFNASVFDSIVRAGCPKPPR